jgi:Restriction endonuclease
MTSPAALSGFAVAADELRRQEFARLADAVTPRLEAFRSMTPAGFRDEIAAMLERLGHVLITGTPDLVTTKEGRKYITACAVPTDQTPVKTPALSRLHDAIVAANAARGFYVTPRSFTPAAEQYAESAPIDLVDGALLIKAMHKSRKGVLLPQTYKAMCRQCGEIVQHRLDNSEALPCGGGHLVPPTIARAALIKPRPPQPQQPASANPKPGFAAHPAGANAAKTGRVIRPRNMSAKAQRRRAIKAHNQQMRARALRQQPDDG